MPAEAAIKNATSSGFDAPVAEPTADMLSRAAFARKVYELLRPTNNDFSVRVGLTGEWGSGKTSVAKWIEVYAKPEGHEVIWFNPWAITNIDDLWLSFYQTLRNSLKIPEPEGLRANLRERAQNLVSKIKKPAESLSRAHSVSAAVATTILDFAKITSEEIKQLRSRVGDKRIIVIIDDLDRADPTLLARLLLSLRELFDIPGFSFLIPFDMDVVSDALISHHPAWKTGDQFLEKILDYRISLPELTQSAKAQLFSQSIATLSPAFRSDLVGDALKWLPENPRTIKSLARIIQPIDRELVRHGPDEIDWRTLLFAAIAKAESSDFFDTFTAAFFHPSVKTKQAAVLSSERVQERKKLLREILTKAKLSSIKEDRLTDLYDAWLSDVRFDWLQRASYAVRLFDSPDSFTWKEFAKAKDIWRSSIDIKQSLDHLAAANHTSGDGLTSEFVKACCNQYGNILERASNANFLRDHQRLISEARTILDMIEALFFFIDDPKVRLSIFDDLVQIVRAWVNFNVNTEDSWLRIKEGELLEAMIRNAGLSWEGFGKTVVDLAETTAFAVSPVYSQLRPVLQALNSIAVKTVLDEMKAIGGAERMMLGDGREFAKVVLLDPTGPAWTPAGQSAMENLLANAASQSLVARNAYSILSRVHDHRLASVEGVRLSQKLVQDHRAVAALWNAVISQQFQHRMLQGLRELRESLVKQGVPQNLLAQPAWMNPP